MDGWARVAGGAGRPFITYYDAATGERTELSGTTAENWIAKTANLLVDDCDAGPGTRIAVGLPSHWMRYVWLLATWAVGATLVEASADVVVAGPDLEAAGSDAAPYRFATALLPFGARFAEPVPGFVDLGEVLPGQPDAFFPLHEEQPSDLAADLVARRVTFDELAKPAGPSPARRACRPGPLERDVDLVASAAHGGGSIVLVSHASDDEFTRIAGQEHADPL